MGFFNKNTSAATELSQALRKKLGSDTIVDIINDIPLEGKKADDAFEETLLKHSRALIQADPCVTIDQVSAESIEKAIRSELNPTSKGTIENGI